MNRLITLLALAIAVLFPVLNAPAPEPAPKVEFCTLEPPPLAVMIDGGDPTNVFTAAVTCLSTNGFSVKSDKREFLLDARKSDPGRPKNYDRVVLWLTRDVAKPEVLKVYMLFGSYIDVFGKGMGRKILEKADEDQITSPWKSKMIEAMENAGG